MFPEPRVEMQGLAFQETDFPTHRYGELKEKMAQQLGGRPPKPEHALQVARSVLGEGASGVALCWGALALLDLDELYPLLENDVVEDIAIQHRRYVYVYRDGKWQPFGEIRDPDRFWGGLRRTCEAMGIRTPSEIKPAAEGSFAIDFPNPIGFVTVRISWSEPPIVPSSCLTIRLARPSRAPDLKQLVNTGVLTGEACSYLTEVIRRRGTLIIAGPTGCGKTTLARALLREAARQFRLVVIEDSYELMIFWNGRPDSNPGNVVHKLTRPKLPGEDIVPFSAFDLIVMALRERPDGIVVGEARGPEAFEILRAANTGHGPQVTTMHTDSLERVWSRYLQMAQSHPDARDLPTRTLASMFAEAVTAVVVMDYREEGEGKRRFVEGIAEVLPEIEVDSERPVLRTVFVRERGALVPASRPIRRGFAAEDLGLESLAWRGGVHVW
ncbi:ATPase, T2SS/T4P/T4SS family [Thermoflexus sp.]|uniref:ATPase, T2SS/T4P/T4SS family n=1 Tax=Thermoflexus sp. TaxID=1969742 RepID=UPI002ADD49C9|nr:ATPase, T2SS/T4P/T4SS family [Thermoflexus sp.]